MTKKELEIEYAKAKYNFRKSMDGFKPEFDGDITFYWSGVCNTYRSLLNDEYGIGKWDQELYKEFKTSTYITR